jgi:ABC-type microcin C transport system permease subunit YejB
MDVPLAMSVVQGYNCSDFMLNITQLLLFPPSSVCTLFQLGDMISNNNSVCAGCGKQL